MLTRIQLVELAEAIDHLHTAAVTLLEGEGKLEISTVELIDNDGNEVGSISGFGASSIDDVVVELR
jgi:hypothetical protein